ncbi:MAG: S41 family peptidase, partial [Acidobacteriota bacterium]
ESALWLLDDPDTHRYTKLTNGGAKHLWPMWGAGGRTLYYMSDESGAENLWSLEVAGSQAKTGDGASGKAVQLTNFTTGRLLWPSISARGDAIVFERDFGLWRYDVAAGKAAQLSFSLRGAPSSTAVEHLNLTADFKELALSPDGKKLAFVARGEVFASAASDPGPARRITNTPAEEFDVSWAPDNRRLLYSSARDGGSSLWIEDVTSGIEKRLTKSDRSDFNALFSPDGKRIAFIRDGKQLRVIDADGSNERLLVETNINLRPPFHDERPLAWSSDSKWIAFTTIGERMFRNVSVIPADGGMARPVSFLGNVGGETVSWSPDGRSIFFTTGQRSEPGDVARIDLTPRVPKFREQQFRDLFKEETPKSVPSPANPEPKSDESKAEAAPLTKATAKSGKEPVEIVFDDIRRRVRLLPIGLDVQSQSVSPDGKLLLIVASAAGQDNLYTYSLDELAKEPAVAKQITSTSGSKKAAQWSQDSKDIYYLDDGKAMKLTLESGKTAPISLAATMDVDFDEEKHVLFDEAWSWMRDNFHDPKMNGADWEALRKDLAPRVDAAHTRDEVRRILSLMVGELNASHLGVRSPGSAKRTTGRLGLRFNRASFERDGRFVISEVIDLSPASVTRKISKGDVLLAVDGVELGASTNLERLLDYKTGKEVRLTLAAPDGSRRDVNVSPVDLGTEKQLAYRDWVTANRDYVRKATDGKVGYVHMFDMSSDSLAQLATDLDAENQTRDAVIIDIRNNNGGFVNAYALDVFSRKPYLNMTFRDLPTASARTVLGQRALHRPTVLLTNQHSLSDAEDFSEGYRALGLGKVIGEPTSGWIIYTSNVELIDGTIFRIPFISITDAKGQPMEMHPRPVDIPVTRPIGEGWSGKDSQLDAAIATLR